MSTTAVTFADRRDVVTPRTLSPRIRADGNFGALRGAGQRDSVSSVRKQIVRNELVEAFITLVNEIELHDAFVVRSFASNCFERFAMEFQNRLKAAPDFRTGRDFS